MMQACKNCNICGEFVKKNTGKMIYGDPKSEYVFIGNERDSLYFEDIELDDELKKYAVSFVNKCLLNTTNKAEIDKIKNRCSLFTRWLTKAFRYAILSKEVFEQLDLDEEILREKSWIYSPYGLYIYVYEGDLKYLKNVERIINDSPKENYNRVMRKGVFK